MKLVDEQIRSIAKEAYSSTMDALGDNNIYRINRGLIPLHDIVSFEIKDQLFYIVSCVWSPW